MEVKNEESLLALRNELSRLREKWREELKIEGIPKEEEHEFMMLKEEAFLSAEENSQRIMKVPDG